jgi:hypothetical protein
MDIERLYAMHHWAQDSTEAFIRSVEAGIDMHMQGDNYFEAVIGAVKAGRIPMRRIEEAAGKILEMKFAVGLFEAPMPSMAPLENASAHRQTALEAARESIVLLKNNGLLPLEVVRRIFVVGPNADSQTILGDWAAPQPDSLVITVLEGIKTEFPGVAIDTMCFGGMISNVNEKGISEARRKASAADVCIVVAGENSQRYSAFGRTCGENCDRDDLNLPGMQEELLEAVASTGKPTILVLMTGRANSLAWAKENVDAILNVWEPGQMGGQAVAEVLSGKVNPSGKLPVTMPRSVGQVPTVYNHKHSQYSRLFATNETGPLWPFGFGLSYSNFAYSNPSLIFGQPSGPGRVHPRSAAAEYGLSPEADPERNEASKAGLASPDRGRPRHARGGTADEVGGGVERSETSGLAEPALDALATVSIMITNEGPYDGAEVVQLYIRDEFASVTRPVKELKAFKRVFLKNGETATVTFEITPEMLQCFGADNKWSVEPGEFTLLVGSSSADEDLRPLSLTIEQ